MARLGDSIDPSLFRQDYSGFADAAAIRSAGLLNFTNQVGAAIADYGEEQKKLKDEAKKGAGAIMAARHLLPELAPRLEPLANELKNPERSLRDQAILGSQIKEMIDLAVSEKRYGEDLTMRREDQAMQRASFDLNKKVTELGLKQAERVDAAAIQNAAIDTSVKKAAGPALLGQLKNLLGPEFQGIKGATPEEDYELAGKLAPFVPKSKETELDLVDIPLGNGGSLKMNRDSKGNLSPLVMPPGVFTPPGEVQPGDLPPPDGMVIPPKQGTPDVIMPGGVVSPGYTPPTASVQDKVALDRLAMEKAKFESENKEKVTTKDASVAKSNQFLSDLKKLESHEGFQGLFGAGLGARMVAGTDAKDAEVLLNKIKGQGFLEAVQALKGMGALSNAEGEKLSSAFLGLETAMSEKAAKAQIEAIKATVESAIQRAGGKVEGPQSAPEKSKAEQGRDILGGAPRPISLGY